MIAFIDYGVGNLGSMRNMLNRIGTESIITSDCDVIRPADKLTLPGIGSLYYAMINLNRLGIIKILNLNHWRKLHDLSYNFF
jgi:glutamine amidotransferase